MTPLPLIITPGDPKGVGPEITSKALRSPLLKSQSNQIKGRYFCVGDAEAFLAYYKSKNILTFRTEEILSSPSLFLKEIKKIPLGKLPIVDAPRPSDSKLDACGFQSGWSIETAFSLIQKKIGSALVTGPISKANLRAGGYSFSGHTDFLEALSAANHSCGPAYPIESGSTPATTPPVSTMMLANNLLRVSLVTVHVPLSQVSSHLSPERLHQTFLNTILGLRNLFGIKKPKIALLGLNPHAGEGGLFGSEEERLLKPALSRIQKEVGSSVKIDGPFPSDTFFALQFEKKTAFKRASRVYYDAVVCLYHDQGLIPVKLLDFKNTVNITLGLPQLIRTSVDHGTAFDIAGKGLADPSSLISAIRMAQKFVSKRST